jgi:hypothetical protein
MKCSLNAELRQSRAQSLPQVGHEVLLSPIWINASLHALDCLVLAVPRVRSVTKRRGPTCRDQSPSLSLSLLLHRNKVNVRRLGTRLPGQHSLNAVEELAEEGAVSVPLLGERRARPSSSRASFISRPLQPKSLAESIVTRSSLLSARCCLRTGVRSAWPGRSG